ncbi:MAG: hypothetical protein ACE5H2_02410 [Terriglobia bacterium]
MRRTRWIMGLTAVLFALAVVIAAPAQDLPLTEKATKKVIKAQDKLLKAAQKAQKRGDTAAVEQNVEDYAASARQLQESLASGQVADDDVPDVVERVDKATLKHVSVLEGLSTKFSCGTPDAQAACHGIERALEVSQRGHEAATAALTNHARVDLAGETLTKRSVRDAVKKNEALLRHAERAERRGDNRGVQQAVAQHARNTDQINQAIENGQVDTGEAVSVLERVDAATRKHLTVLERVHERCLERGHSCQGIERALEASRHGNEAATAALARTPAGARRAGRGGTTGRPSSVGRSRGQGPGGRPTGGRPGGSRPGGKPPRPPRP